MDLEDTETNYIQVLYSPKSKDQDDLYYIGRTKNIVDRLKRHQSHKGAKCLQNRETIFLKELFWETPFLELVKTLEYMQEYGISKVRGGPFVKEVHTAEDLATIENLLESESFKRAGSSMSTGSSPTEHRADKPGRQGQKWTLQEYNQMVSMYKERMSKSQISKHLERSEGSIEAKLLQVIKDAQQKGSSDEALAQSLNLSVDQLNEWLSGKPVWTF